MGENKGRDEYEYELYYLPSSNRCEDLSMYKVE